MPRDHRHHAQHDSPGASLVSGERRRRGERSTSLGPEPGWYRDAVIYELHVRSFADSNADGVGDFPGLIERLDYLADLGVTAIWLLPFYPSPLRDDGYDIADYTGVNPAYGTRADVKRLVVEAHRRGLRVITELVINHTSDQHPWFQRARLAPPGSKERSFYVWRDQPHEYADARIIFQDFETSNWTYDPVAGQYFWHRFYHHQPDLNFENPAVAEALLRVLDQWFELGVDGMRLDAVPYLFERDGTNCENLPETHDFLRRLRTHVDQRWPGRMLLAEANQWPEDAVAYFGQGDECHMCFHFPLMPRLFMGVRMEDRFPIIDIMQQTPPIPETCQWAIFLRNHDELTLEMVTDEERDYMYRSYAGDRQMRINLGIRRRLAPLLGNNRRKIELLNGLLFSLPGTPVLYYGDEIGMGDNVYLGDRDSVRTPMQWSGDRNAGFSRANPQQLFLPVIIDPEYHAEMVNVERQHANPSSLLWWMKRLIALRRRHAVFGRGDVEFLQPANPRVLAYVRRFEDEHVLVVANLSRFAQPVELDLSAYEGQRPVEMFGHIRFPAISAQPYPLALGPHAFYWLALSSPTAVESRHSRVTPEVIVDTPIAKWLGSSESIQWLGRVLPEYLPGCRWFGSKSRIIREVGVDETIALPLSEQEEAWASIAIIRVTYTDAEDEQYVIPLMLEPGAQAAATPDNSPATVGFVLNGEDRYMLSDATTSPGLWKVLATTMDRRRTIRGKHGALMGTRFPAAEAGDLLDPLSPVTPPRAEQSNSSATFGEKCIVKLFRRVQEGQNPDLEIGHFLTERTSFTGTPALLGAIEYRPARGEATTIAMAQQFVQSQGDAWRYAIDSLDHHLDRALTLPTGDVSPQPDLQADVLALAMAGPAAPADDTLAAFSDTLRLLGQRTAEMHAALASDQSDPAFRPEEFSRLYQRALYQSLRNNTERALQTLRSSLSALDERTRPIAQSVLDARTELLARLKRVSDQPIDTVRIRCHGDFHLGQVLWTGRDMIIIDFEGEPARPIGERRLKRSPLMDVAGMLRSLQYASHVGLREQVERGSAGGDEERARLEQFVGVWRFEAERAFLSGYFAHIRPPLVPTDPASLRVLLEAWLMNKACSEVLYELNHRPHWTLVPLRGLAELLNHSPLS